MSQGNVVFLSTTRLFNRTLKHSQAALGKLVLIDFKISHLFLSWYSKLASRNKHTCQRIRFSPYCGPQGTILSTAPLASTGPEALPASAKPFPLHLTKRKSMTAPPDDLRSDTINSFHVSSRRPDNARPRRDNQQLPVH